MKRLKKALLILLAILTVFTLYVFYSQDHLVISEYKVTAKVENPVRIVQLTDLHNHEFGDDNFRLIEKVNSLQPDLIVMTGDMINEDDPDISIVCNLIKALKDTAPVYFSIGNHEKDWQFGRNINEEFIKAGAILVDNSYVDTRVNGSTLRIGGYYGYYRAPHMKYLTDELAEMEERFFDDFEDTDQYKILLSHVPTAWVDWNYTDQYPVDLILSGHYHGGQVRIPLVGGLYAPYAGWFPKNTKGVFSGKYGTCILSTGLGSEMTVPRINNDPEITVIDLVQE